jgi:hypothetical protein
VALTGFDRAELLGTGMLTTYYDTLLKVIGEREAGHLLQAVREALTEDKKSPSEKNFDNKVVKNERYGPVVLSLIKLWYLGSWYPLSRKYRDRYGSTSHDVEHVVSAQSYREGLVWVAAGAHPMGAKPPGFGSWAEPSYLPPIA